MHLDFGRGHVNTRRHDTWGNKFQFDTGIPAPPLFSSPLSRDQCIFIVLLLLLTAPLIFIHVCIHNIPFSLFLPKHLQTQIKSHRSAGTRFATESSDWERQTDGQTGRVEKCLIRMEKRLSTKQCMLASIMMNEKCLFEWEGNERRKKLTLNTSSNRHKSRVHQTVWFPHATA